jgi:7-keto-8-aminopelargonate synthetase-like enzyme
LAALSKVIKGNLQQKLFDNVEFAFKKLSQCGFKLNDSKSQIIPIIIGQEKKALEFSNQLLDNGIFVQAVRFPTVKKGSARLRISLTALNGKNQLKLAIDTFKMVGKRLEVI